MQACPPSAGYRLWKFARRNKAALLTLALVTLLLVLGAGISTWQAIRATRAEKWAQTQFEAESRARQEADDARAKAVAALQEAEQQRDRALEAERQALANFQKAREAVEFRKGGDSFDWFFLAVAHWQLGEKDKARPWYDRAVQWMEKNQSSDEELRRFRAEAAELLGVKEKSE